MLIAFRVKSIQTALKVGPWILFFMLEALLSHKAQENILSLLAFLPYKLPKNTDCVIKINANCIYS